MELLDMVFDDHWGQVVTLVLWIATVVNGHTKNWKDWPTRIGKILGLALKVVGLWTADKESKWEPGDPERREKPTGAPVTTSLILAIFLTGCATNTAITTLKTAREAAIQTKEIAFPIMNGMCLEYAEVCVSNGVGEDECETLKKCQNERNSCGDALKAVHLAFAAGALANAGGSLDAVSLEAAKAVSHALRAQECVDLFIDRSDE